MTRRPTPRTALIAVITLLHLGTAAPLHAQQAWTLRQCCEYAVEHNISIQQQQNQCRQQEIKLNNAKNSRLPDVSGSASQNFSFGRGLTADNTYSNTNTSSTSFQVGASVPLFTGFQIPNQIKLSQLNLQASTADLEKAKNDIRMQVAQAYIEILYSMEIHDVALRQITIDSMQVVRLQAFVENGKASEAELAQQRATLAGSRLTATQALNNIRLATLTLTQLLELPSAEAFTIQRPLLSVSSEESSTFNSPIATPGQIYAEALGIKPEIASQQLRLRGAEYSIKIAKAGYYPTLSANGGLGTSYHTTSGYPTESFGKQLKNQFSQYVGLSLNVPIFNRFQTRNNIRLAKLEQQSQQLQLENAKKTLYKEIQQVYLNALNAQSKALASAEALNSSESAFHLTQAKYENGKATITEFNESKANYLKAASDLVQARYENIYQRALIQFYRGQELAF